MSLLNVRQKEVETIEAIIYHPELPDGVQRILDNSGDSNACLMEKTVAVVYELDILPENPDDLGKFIAFSLHHKMTHDKSKAIYQSALLL